MNPLDLLSDYLRRVERRLRLLAWTRGAALAAAAALASTVILVLIANYFAFSDTSVTLSRVALFVALALAIGFGLLLPLVRLNIRRAAKEAEEKFPQFEERLLTFAEASKTRQGDPFLHLLAADTLHEANRTEPVAVAAPKALIGLGSAAAAAVAVLIWLGMAGPGFWGYGTSLLWAGPPRAEVSPFYDLAVEPGNKTVRKRADQIITARTTGFAPQSARLFVKYMSASKWEETAMRPRSGGPGYEFLLSGVPESLEYYVTAGALKSKTFKLTVVDLPAVKRIRVTYKYPAWSGMKPETEDPGGDLRAPEGTEAELAITTDRPLANGFIIVDDGTRIPIQDGRAIVPMKKDGVYYIAGVEQGEDVRLTDDYFIEAGKDSPPTVKVRRPGRDAKVSPIEEVTVEVEGQDDFGLQDLKLHYSVNGGAEKTVSFLQSKGQKTADGRTILYLEDYKMAPGDIVSVYASARDARSTTSTNMFFIEAQPFERNYTQSQQAGGGGGGGEMDQEGEISRRQKEIISATWNQLKDTSGNRGSALENAKFLSSVQSKLKDQAKSLANRMRSRELAGANEQFKSFVQDMEKAVEAMGPASEKLGTSKWQEALPHEQKALQHLLRAEATFRDIQVAFGNRGGGGGGGGGGRELESLFDLELDTEKNQYESNQQAGGGSSRDKEIDEALQKLEQLARRQQELAEQARKNQQTSQQRWQQEMLRREAEELKRQMEQLSRGNSSQQSQSQQGQQGQSGQQSSQGGQSGQQSQRDRQLDQAIERLRQATKDMQNASSSQQNGSSQGEAEARRAAERLQEARDMLSGMRQRETGDQVSDLSRRAERLAERQQNFNRNLRQEYGNQQQPGQSGMAGGPSRDKANQLAAEKESMRKELEQIEKDMQQATRDLAGSDKSASSKMRRALGDLQQDEVQRNMRWSAEAIRRGLGGYTIMRDATQTQALNDLRDKMKDIESSVGKDGKGEKGLEQALQQTEALRRQMERLGRGDNQRGQQPGRQPGQQPGQQGQQGQQGQGQQAQQGGQQPGQQGQQNGQQQGQQGQSGQQGGQVGGGQRGGGDEQRYAGGGGPRNDNGDGFRAMNRGGYQLPDGPRLQPGGNGIESIEQLYREGLRDLSQLRQSVRETDPEVEREVADLIREMQRLDPKRFPGNPELVERLRGEVLASLEQIELQLRRKLEDKQGSSVRSGASDRVPAGYATSVADYFRKLSK